jgi:hypothetical protein
MSLPLSLIYFMMPSTNCHVMNTPAKLAERAQQNELQYTKEVHNMMRNPKERHLRDELNRKKICNLIDKYVTRLYGSQHITWWAAQNKNKTIFDLVTMSDLAYTVAVIENGHEIWDQLNEHRHLLGEERQQIREGEQEESSTKKTPKFTKKTGKKRE